ncbi:MAG: hypothetical protein U0840_29030 [Gemmataceae bacterium]
MRKMLKLISLTVLTLIVLSPLVVAAPNGHRSGNSFGPSHTAIPPKPTFNKPTFNKPTFNHDSRKPFGFDPHPNFTGGSNFAGGSKFFGGSNFPGRTFPDRSPGFDTSSVIFRGQNHAHWSRRFFSPTWGAWFFFCPQHRNWFYFHAGRSGFLPINALSSAPPQRATQGQAFLPPGGASLPLASPSEFPQLPTR